MNKIDLINKISTEFGISKIESSEYLESLLEVLTKSFRKGKNINIAEFGKLRSFTKYIEDGRRGKFVSFSPVKKLADDVNSDFNDLFATTVALLNDKSRFDLISIEELEPEEDSIIVFDDSGYEDIPVERFVVDEEPEDLIERNVSGSDDITIEEIDYELDSKDQGIEEIQIDSDEIVESFEEKIPEAESESEEEILHEVFDDEIIDALKTDSTNDGNVIEQTIEQEPDEPKSFYEELLSEPDEISFEDVTPVEQTDTDSHEISEVDNLDFSTEEEIIEEETEPVTISDKVSEIIPFKEKDEDVEFVDPDDLLPGHRKDDVIENVVSPPDDRIALTDDLMKIIEERRRLLLESDNDDETETVEPEKPVSEPEVTTETITGETTESVIDEDELSKVEAERQRFLDEQKTPKKEISNILEEYGIYRDPVEEEVEQKPADEKQTDDEDENFNSILKQYGIYNEENGKHDTDAETKDVAELDDDERKVKNILEEYGIQRDPEGEKKESEEPESGNILDEYGVKREADEDLEIPVQYDDISVTKDSDEKKPEQEKILDENLETHKPDEVTTAEKEVAKTDDDIKIPEMDFGKIFKEGNESETEAPEEIVEDEREVIIPDDLKTLHEEISEVKEEVIPPPTSKGETSYDDVFELRSETTSQRRDTSKQEYNIGLNKEEEEKDESKIFTLSFVILIVVVLIVALLTYAVFNYGLIGSGKEKAQEIIIEDNAIGETLIEEVPEQNQRLDLLKTDEEDEVEETTTQTGDQETAGEERQLAPGEEVQIAYPEAKVVIIRTKDGYFVQVGSYSRENIASQKVNELKGKGAEAFMIKSELDRGTFYRVRVGSFNNIDAAKSYADKNLK